MRTVYIIELNNRQDNYAICSEFIKAVESFGLNNQSEHLKEVAEKLQIAVANIHTDFSPRYIEEPISSSDRGNIDYSIHEKPFDLKTEMDELLSGKIVMYHLRIHFDRNGDNDNWGEIINLQYLAMMLKSIDSLVFESNSMKRRLTVFMVPLTGNRYPFVNAQGDVDYDTYSYVSSYLRLISKRYTGVIYSVREKCEKPIVTSLNFKQSKQGELFFPLLLIDKNKYDQLFSEPINDILEELFSLKINARFRNAAGDNPDTAMADYLAETSIKRIRSVISSSLEEWTKSKEELLLFLQKKRETCLVQFSLFAFMLSKREPDNNDIYSYENIWQLTFEIAKGLRQVVQNSLQHSAHKTCFFAFYFHTRGMQEERNAFYERLAQRFPEIKFQLDNRDEALEVIISDINEQEDMIDTFVSNLEYEVQQQMLVHESASPGHQALIRDKDKLAVRNFFAEYKDDDPIQSWLLFRREDLVAHIGLGQFAQAAKRCNAAIKVISNKQRVLTNENRFYYKAYATEDSKTLEQMSLKKQQYVIPGTQFSILIPVGMLKFEYKHGISQLRQKKHVAEDYKSFAAFLEYKERQKNVEVVEKENDSQEYSNDILNAKAKFAYVQRWTKYWSTKFVNMLQEHIDMSSMGDFTKYVINYNFSQAVNLAYFSNGDRIEVCLKGILGALQVIKKTECYLAMTNLPDGFIDTFRRICTLLGVKDFPQNLQLFMEENHKEGKAVRRVVMLGNDFSQAISNAYVLSLEQGVEGFDKRDCKRAKELKELLIPHQYVEDAKAKSNIVGAMPFDVILSSSEDASFTLFEMQLKKMAEGALGEDIVGYKLNDTHMRLGSKVHIEAFYEMSFLFYRTTIANRLAFMILRNLYEMKNDEIDLQKDSVLFYGYASYSKAILTSITEILQEYRKLKGAENAGDVAFASFQHNLMLESEETQMYFGLQDKTTIGKVDENNRLKLDNKIKIVQIVPISSTLTTFGKMWNKFVASTEEASQGNIKLFENYTIFWVTDRNGNTEKGEPSNIEAKYWERVIQRDITTKLVTLHEAKKEHVHFFIRSAVKWNDPLTCQLCYPKYTINEVPLVETDPTSTVPTQQIRYKKHIEQDIKRTDEDFFRRFMALDKCVLYDHICRRQNHYQYYIDTQKYFYKVKGLVKEWLQNQKNNMDEGLEDPILHIIFSPEHNTNVGFAQYVNTYYFQGLAEIVSINVDKQFRSNFVCEHAALKQVISELYQDSRNGEERPVKFYFVDDTIISGVTFEKANGLLQSLMPDNVKITNLFSKVFLLVDRLSNDTKQIYVGDTESNLLSFLHIDVSNTRTYGDSCVGCKLKQDAEKMFKRSATKNMANYWAKKISDYKKKEYDNRDDTSKIELDKSYCMLAFSHIVQNIFVKQNRCNKLGDVYDTVMDLSCWLLAGERKDEQTIGNAYGFEEIIEQYRNLFGLERLIKVICRPFFSYDFTIKRQLFTFFILMAELYMGLDQNDSVSLCQHGKEHIKYLFENNNSRVNKMIFLVNSIKRQIKDEKKSVLLFLQQCILESLTDMGSTYVMRKQTLQRAYIFLKECSNEEQIHFWEAYEVSLHRLVTNNADETRELWLEYLYMTGQEYADFEAQHKNLKKKKFTPRFFYEEITSSTEEDKAFYRFCTNLFLQNIGINFDELEGRYAQEGEQLKKNKDKYSSEYWRQMCCLTQFINPFYNVENGIPYKIESEEILFKFLNTRKDGNVDNTVRSVNVWYKTLLQYMETVIREKYNAKEINIALLTETMNDNQNSSRIQTIEIVEERLQSCRINLPETKYCIKERVANALDKPDTFDLTRNGYYLNEDVQQEREKRPYVIAFFNNAGDDRNMEKDGLRQDVISVFLYISVEEQTQNQNSVFILRLILREVMTYRNRIMRRLQRDFVGDLYARYTRKSGEQNILSHEKAHSHNTTADDMITLEIFQTDEKFKKDYKMIDLEDAKDWLLLRNYTNGQIAKMFNRSFQDVHDENKNRTDSPMLYLSGNSRKIQLEPFKTPMKCFEDLKLNDADSDTKMEDRRVELLKKIIEFRFDESVKKALFVQGVGGEYYNLEYFRCILIDMLISAIKYQSTRPDYLLRIDRLFLVQDYLKKREQSDYSWTKEDAEMTKLYEQIKKEKCVVEILRKESPYEGIDYLVIRNPINAIIHKMNDWESKNKSIEHRLNDPLDFADGHMSLLTIKRYIENLNAGDKKKCVFCYTCEGSNKDENDETGKKLYYFENWLPILREEKDETNILDR